MDCAVCSEESFKKIVYSKIGGFTGLGGVPSCHVIVAVLKVTDSDITFIGALGTTTVCKIQQRYCVCVHVHTCVYTHS